MKKILVINSNSNPEISQIIKAGIANSYNSKEIEVVIVNPETGPQGIDNFLDVAISTVETIRIVARNRRNYDAFIIACGSDPGLDACRLIADAPVIGISEAGMLIACTLGYKFAIIVNNDSDIPRIEEMVSRYGLRQRLAAARGINLSTAELKNHPSLIERLVKVGNQVIEDDHAEVIILPGSIQIGLEGELAEAIGAPVLSGMACALKLAELLIGIGQKTSRIRKYRNRKKLDSLIGYIDFQDVYSLVE